MKINPLERQQPPISPPASKIQKEADNEAFKNVLDQAVHKTRSKGAFPPPQVQRAGATSPVLRSETSTQVCAEVDHMLNGLERYQGLLGNGRVSLRAVETALQKVRDNVDELEPLVAKMPATDPVKSIAQEALMVACKEIVRFEQGEYIDD